MYLYKVLIGATPPGRNTEQHDIFFGIATSLTELVPQLKTFWPEAVGHMHVDAFRTVTKVGHYNISVVQKNAEQKNEYALFFINLGGYKPNEFDEFHYKMLIVAKDKADAIQQAKATAFYKHTGYAGAPSHIDDKFGVDVDDIYAIDDILHPHLKAQYSLLITLAASEATEDIMHLGYYKMSKIEQGQIEPS